MGLIRRGARPEPEQADTPSTATLLSQLDDPRPDCRREAALGLVGVAEGVPALLDRVAGEPAPAVRDAILTTLAGHDTATVAERLAGHLGSDDPGLRTAVAETLASMPVSVPALLPRLLEDPDHHVRVMTAMLLADLPHPAAQTWLARMIAEDPHPNVVAGAIDALLPSFGPEHADLLRAAAERFPDDPFLRFTVAAALAP